MLLVLIVLLSLGGTASADSYTFTTSPAQERALSYIIDQQPPVGDPLRQPTKTEHITGLLNQLLATYSRQLREANILSAQELKGKYDNSTPEVRSQVDSLLGQ